MDSMICNKMLHILIYTGTPGEPPKSRPREKTNDNAFRELPEQRLKEESQVSFSKHAMECVVKRGVDVSSEKLDRPNEGVRIAEEKGLGEPLILLGTTVFVVNVKNNKVVTVVNENSLKGIVFTNIDGTVMIQPILLEAILTPNDGRASGQKRRI